MKKTGRMSDNAVAAAELQDLSTAGKQRPMMSELYRRAEAQLKTRAKLPGKAKEGHTSTQDYARDLHELQVHQIELELQNAELQRTRNELENLLEEYTDLYDFAPVGYFTLDAQGRICLVNLTGARLVGADRSQLMKRPFSLHVTQECQSTFRAFLKTVFQGNGREKCEIGLVHEGRKECSVSVEAQRSSGARECRMVVVDTSERKRVEDAVRVSETRYRRLFETAHDGVLVLDPVTCKITDANPFMTRLLGYPNAQLVGKELYEIGLLKDESASQEMFRNLKKQHEVRYEDLPLESKSGRHQEVEVVANLYRENGHEVIQCNIRDITERKLAENALRNSEALLSSLVEQAPFGMYVVDSRFRLQQVNRKARPVFKNVDPLIGRDFQEIHRQLWQKRVSDPVVKRFRHTLKTGEPYHSPEFTERRRDTGVVEVYEWQIQRVTLPSGEHGVVAFFNNITERKLAEAARRRIDLLSASNQKLEMEIVQRKVVEKSLKESERQQGLLLRQSGRMQQQLRLLSRQILMAQEDERRAISRELHDVIAQTLTSINVRLESLKKDAVLDSGGLDRNIARTQKLVEKSVEIVHQFARELRPTVLDDLGLIPALHTFLKLFTTRTGIRSRFTAAKAVEQLDIGCRTALFRVTQEALTNVARHAKASRVDVCILKTDEGIAMHIRDNGKSFSVERVTQNSSGKHLGLLGMKERMEMVGGGVTIQSSVGKGTTVEALIPLRKTVTAGISKERKTA